MKILLDTNIIIHREASRIVLEDIGQVFKWLDKLGYTKYVHPITVEEINRLKDENTRKTLRIKLSSYTELIPLDALDASVSATCTPLDYTGNDINDTRLINEVFKDRVDLLITEDRKIKTKAQLLNIPNRVLTVNEFLERVTNSNPEFTDYKVLSVRRTHFANIDSQDKFFDSFREDYPEFDTWFNRKSQETAYISRNNQELLGFLYLKLEDQTEPYPEFQPAFARKKRLKIGTFKTRLGRTLLGERLLKIAFDAAIRNEVDEIYVTVFEGGIEKQWLINLLLAFGFVRYGIKNQDNRCEDVYVRDMRKDFDYSNPKITYPYFGRRSRAFIVPIRPEYHTKLFPDSIVRGESPSEYVGNAAFLNSISKVYVSRSHFKDLISGDIVIFYRTGGFYRGAITTVGIVENVARNITSPEKFVRLCRKRSVFSDEELLEFWNKFPNLKPFIVNFLYAYSFPPPLVNMERLIDLGVIKDKDSAPRGFELLSNSQFELILKETNTSERIIVD
jgi:hypothetical protein